MQNNPSPGSGPSKPKPNRVQCPCCEHVFDTNKSQKPRSMDQHKRFFGLVRAAFHHWPEHMHFQPDSEEHLRAWLICMASPDYRTTNDYSMPNTGHPITNAALMEFTEQIAMNEIGRKGEAFAFKRWIGLTFRVTRPKSIKWNRMLHMKFCTLNNAVEDVIKDVFGVTGDQLLEQHKAAA